jgi:hypothetical protein
MEGAPTRKSVRQTQLLTLVTVVLKLELTLWPNVVTAVTQATRISASMIAYSTAVGPSSLAMKLRMR